MNIALQLIEKAARDGRIAHLLLFHGGSALFKNRRPKPSILFYA